MASGLENWLQECIDKTVSTGIGTGTDPNVLTDREATAAMIGHLNHLITEKTSNIMTSLDDLSRSTKRLIVPLYLVFASLVANILSSLAKWIWG